MLFKSVILKFLPLLPLAQADGLRGATQQKQEVPLDQQEDEHSTSSTRQLSSEMVFTPLSCNESLDVSACSTETTLSSILKNADTTKEVLIPCGTCALVDTTDGSTVNIPAGINIEGMLFFPSTSHVTIETTHIFVQGKLKMDPPALASSNSIRIRMVGSDNQYLHPHEENSASCDVETGCSVGKKAIVVAGGQLDINGLYDSDCPAFTKLKAKPSATQIQLETTEDSGTVWIQFGIPTTTASDCWGIGDEVLITNTKGAARGWNHQLVRIITAVDQSTGTFTLSEAIDDPLLTTEVEPDMASEVASLSRKIIFEAEGDGPSDTNYSALHGGHLMIFHTPDVAQRLEGVEIRNFGQQGNIGRYPIHFHMSNRVTGSIVRKNVIRESKQRCVVIHGSHDVSVEDNVAFDSYGHCYMLEDGAEIDNHFIGNLGARTRGIPDAKTTLKSSDKFGATFWITNTKNHFIGNVAAGSGNSGFWFELRDVRGDSKALYPDVNPRLLPLYTFRDNTSHSNGDMGVRTYAPGFLPPTEALFQSIKIYQNRDGVFIHGTRNLRISDAFIAHNMRSGVLYFGNGNNNILEDSTIIGDCGRTGISFSLEPTANQLQVKNTSFFGFSEGCENNPGAALRQGSAQAKSAYGMPVFTNLSFDSNAVDAVVIAQTFDGRSIFFEDPDGGMNPSGEPGFFVNDVEYNTVFVDEGACSAGTKGAGLFCQNICMRRVDVFTGCCSKKFEKPTNDYKMVVTSVADPSRSFTFDKYVVKSGLWYHAPAFIFALPSGDYNLHFIDENDGSIKVPSVNIEFGRNDPSCTGHVTEESFTITCPPNYVLGDDGLTCHSTTASTLAPTASTTAPTASTSAPSAATSAPSYVSY